MASKHDTSKSFQPGQNAIRCKYWKVKESNGNSFQFRHKNRSPSRPICVGCNSSLTADSIFYWINCNHSYCNICYSEIINKSLSIFNQPPKCIGPNCNQLLTVQHERKYINLATKYRNKETIIRYNHKESLIYGYIGTLTNIDIVSINIISLIFDYYILSYFSKMDCNDCKSVGYHLFECTQCDGNGIGNYCDKCKGYGRFVRNGIDRGICYKCNGSGIRKRRSGYYKEDCDNCNGKGNSKHKCTNCDGYKQVLVLDFNKLCERQSLCNKCNKYVPNDMVFYWTNCHHTFCYHCILSYIKKQINKRQIPICFKSKCKHYLAMKELKLINMNGTKWNLREYCNKLKILISVNNKFKCTKCLKMRLPEQEFIWTKCNHEYCAKCAANIINKSLSILNEAPLCIKCKQLLDIRDGDKLKNSLLTRYKSDSAKIKRYLEIIDCYNCNDIGNTLVDCVHCQGFRYININRIDRKRVNRKQCKYCNGNGKIYKCDRCSGKQRIEVLNYQRLCNNQSLCSKCNQYFTKNMISVWSRNCCHSFCYECIGYYSAKQIHRRIIPICLSANCNQELTPQRLQLLDRNKGALISMLTSIYRTNRFLCTSCGVWYNLKNKKHFVWTKCEHRYCDECAFRLINGSLSTLNKVPRCIHPKCNQSLGIKDGDSINHGFLTKYTFNKQSVCNNHCRECLKYFTKINCRDCKAYGYHAVNCQECDAKGWCLISCQECKASGVRRYCIRCSKCDGSGNYVTQSHCNPCNGSGIYNPGECRRCSGTGRFSKNNNDVGTCFNCKGTGQYTCRCTRCDGSGINTKKRECRLCDGDGTIHKKVKCSKCNGLRRYRKECSDCDGKGKVRHQCNKCDGDKQIMALDFNKLCDKQLLCGKCGYYLPDNMIIHWSTCNHTYCHQCMSQYVKIEIHNNRHPICYQSMCNERLNMAQLGLIGNKYCDKLKTVIALKNRFICSKCFVMISSELEFVWTKCNHKYCKTCASKIINESLSIFNQIPRCIASECNQSLCFKDGNAISNALLAKYDNYRNHKNAVNYHQIREYLIYGYIRRIRQHAPTQLIVLIFDYYILGYFTKSNCYHCKASGYQLFDCKLCHGIGYTTHCKQCREKIDCSCSGMQLSVKCNSCYGNKQIMALDFNKLCRRQSLCGKCNFYFPNDMVCYWTNCYHPYCYQCISLYIKRKLNNHQMPICLIPKCKQHLAMKQLKLMNINNFKTKYCNRFKILISENNRFKCNKCLKMKLPEQEFLWTKCNHKYCTKCAPNIINSLLSLNKAPYCIVSKCNELLDIRDGDRLKDSLLTRYKIDSAKMKRYYAEHRISEIIDCYNCNGIGNTLVECVNCQGFGSFEDSKHAINDIYKCRGSGYNHQTCKDCNGNGKVSCICYCCFGNKRISVFDFNKLFDHQSLCVECARYFPNNMVKYWSRPNCYHSFCNKCLFRYIENEINHKRIPVCSSPKCYQELTVQRLQLISVKDQTLIRDLATLIYRKNRFKCTFCDIWHKNEEKFAWSICKHEYGKQCIKVYVDQKLPKEESVFNIFKAECIPKCYGKHCGQKLELAEASKIDFTQYQRNTLKKLIFVSQKTPKIDSELLHWIFQIT